MAHEPLRYRGVGCAVCDRRFDDMDEFKGHADRQGEPCPGGTPA